MIDVKQKKRIVVKCKSIQFVFSSWHYYVVSAFNVREQLSSTFIQLSNMGKFGLRDNIETLS